VNLRNIGASIRTQLLNKARTEKLDYNLVLTRYALERMLDRLSRGQRAEGSGQWAVGSGQWAVGSGQWAVGSGQWAESLVRSALKFGGSVAFRPTPTLHGQTHLNFLTSTHML